MDDLDASCVCGHTFASHCTPDDPHGGPCAVSDIAGAGVYCACPRFGSQDDVERIFLAETDEDEAMSIIQNLLAAGYRFATVPFDASRCGLCGAPWTPEHADQGSEHYAEKP